MDAAGVLVGISLRFRWENAKRREARSLIKIEAFRQRSRQEIAVNQINLRNLQIGMTEVSRLLLPFALIWLLGAIGLGWLVKSLLILFGLLLLLPVLAFIGFRWWLKRSLVQSACPICSHEFVSLNHSEFRCPSCNEPLKAEQGHFSRLVPPGTIDVNAIDVTVQQIED